MKALFHNDNVSRKCGVHQQSCGSNSEYTALLQFCEIFLEQRREVFISPPLHTTPNTPPLNKPISNTVDEEFLTQSYLRWYLSRILVLLGYTSCEGIHGRTREIIVQLLQAIKSRDRSNQCEVVLTPAQLNVDDVEYCEQLQLNLTKVLCDIGYDLGSFCPIIEAQALLESLCCQLEIGEESLRLACVLLHSCPRIITDIELCNFFLDCVVAMVRLLCTGLPLVTDLKDSTGEFPNLGLRGLEQLLEGLGETLQEEGLGRLKTHGLRAALGSLMANILETLPTQHQLSFICMPHRSRLVRALTNEIGTSTDLQYLVGCLVKAVLCELMGNQTSVEGISLFHSDTPKASGNARKRKLDGSVLLAPKVPNKSGCEGSRRSTNDYRSYHLLHQYVQTRNSPSSSVKNDPSWVDLKPANPRGIVKVTNVLAPKLDEQCSAECVGVLALLPKDVAHKWRVHIFRQALESRLVDVTGSPRERPRLVDANMFLPFMQLAQSDSVHIRKESLRYVFGHIGVRKNNAATINILTTALKFVEDTDYDIRVAFSEVVQHVFGGEEMSGSDDTSDLVLTKLQDVFTQARLKDIADYKNTQTQNLFMRCRHDVCKFLVNAMHDAQTGKMGKSADDILTEVSRVLGFPDVKTFLSGTKKYIVPYLVSKGTPAASTLVKLIATHLDIARETNIDLPNLLRLDFQRVHNELLLHLSTNFSQVFNGLKMLSTFDENWKGGVVSTHEDMAAYLQPRILGVLAHFDSPLLNASIPMEEKRPVMSTLRIGLQIKDEQFTEISCRAWNCFVRSLELPFLGQMMSQIIATLLPLLELMPKQVADIFNYMIVDNRETMKSQFHDIYFLPDLPELAEANAVLKKYTDNLASQLDFKSQLRHTLKGVQHESLDVRLHALSKLKKLLKDERVAFSELVMESETASPLVSGLISVLLKGCREGDVRAQGLYAECLGQCGAIDPGRLELATNNPKVELANFQNSILKEKFAFALINEVVKSYLAATEPRIQDCSALALQDLLQIYGISEKSEDERTQKLWNGFTSQVKEILIPFMSTKYILAPTQYNWANLHKPIYGSRKGSTFKDWVSTWTLYLSSKVRAEGKPFKVFRACSAVIKFNVHLALYILPYVVLHVLQDGTQADINEVVVEIEEVLTQVTGMDGGRAKVAVGFHHMAAQTIFSVLDYLTKWKFLSQQIKAAGSQGETALSRVKGFLECIPQDKLAEASFQCKAYTRALMHYELHLKGKQKLTKEQLDFLQRLYRELDEPDGVQGVAAIRQSTPSLSEQILTYSGRLGCQVELQACYEQAIQNEPEDLSHHQGLLRCLMDLSQPAQALHHASGAIANTQGWMLQLLPFQVEAAWKLGHWTDLQNFSTKSEGEFLKQLQVARQEQVGPLSAASMEMGSYQRGYEHIVRLHILNEIVESLQLLMDFLGDGGQGSLNIGIPDLMAHWQTRLKMMQSSFRIQEPVLTMRRTLMTLAQQDHDINFDIETEIAHSWLSSAKTAQKTGYVQTATRFLLQASEYNLPQYCLQKAKWHWEKDEHEQAMSLLEQQMVVHFTNVNQILADQSEAGKAKRRVYAKALLLYGRYSEETSRIESNQIVKKYKEVIETDPEWEHGHFYLGKYFDKIMTTLVDEKNDVSKQGEFVVHVVKNLGNSLRHGNTFIYQSLPRLLSLWLDFGSSVVELEKREQPRPSMSLQKNRSYLGKLNKMIETFGRQLAPYQLFFAFSQLTSRICHAHQEVFIQLKTIIARLVVAFPQQALWMLMAVSKSSLKTREATPSLAKVIQDYTKLTERLLELCEKELEAGKSVSITTYFKPLKRLIDDSSLSKILVPLQSLMTVNLPSTVDRDREHDPFPANLVYISGFEDDDDLRKDCRLMEFNGIVNKFLRKDPESRKRFLYMRTYTVIPLNELCGLLEWVNNTRGLRAILIQLYKEKGLYMPGKELQGAMPNLQASIETKKQALRTKLLPRHPPVFGEWFLRTFTDPTSWYNARLAYCKTVAVMSMVGYILGLGDRHGENILFDSTNGDCVHVDFNCLFNRGETFEWPEKVPFRLTHNMVHAMGPTRLEGIYRRACEVTLRVMRKETEPLMSVLKPFVYDPLVEWSKPARGQRQNPAPLNPTGEVTNEQGRVHVQNIEQRLQGILNKGTKRSGLALSVEGHVNHLINEATSEENLCQISSKPTEMTDGADWLKKARDSLSPPPTTNAAYYERYDDDDDDLSLAESLTDVMSNLREQQQQQQQQQEKQHESEMGSGRMASVLANIRLDSKYADDIEYISEEGYAIDEGSQRGENMAEKLSNIMSEARTTVFTGTQPDNKYTTMRQYNLPGMDERHQRELRMEEESARILSEASTTVYTGSPPDIIYAAMREYNAPDMDEHHQCEMRMDEESARILSEAKTTVYTDTQRNQIGYSGVKQPTIDTSASRFARCDCVSVKHTDDDNDLESLDAKLAMLAEKNAKMREASSETRAELQEKLQAIQAIDVRADSNPETTTSDEQFWGPSEPAIKIKSKEPTIANYNQVAASSETTIERELEMNDTPNMYAQRRINFVFDKDLVSLSDEDNTEDGKNEEPCSAFKENDEKSLTDGESEETDDDQTFEEDQDNSSREKNVRKYVAVSGSQPHGEKPFSVIFPDEIGHPPLSAVKHRDSNHVVQSPAKTRPSRKLAKYLAKGTLSSESSDDNEDEQGDVNYYYPAVKMSALLKLNDTRTHKEETMYAPNLVCKPNMTNVKLPSSVKPTVDVNTYGQDSLNFSDSNSESSLEEVQATTHPKIQNELTATDPMMIQKLVRELVQREFNAHEATRKTNSTSETVICGHAGNDKTRIDYGDEFRSEMKKLLEELKTLRKSQKLKGEELRELYEKQCAKYIARADKQLEQIIEDLKREKLNYEILNKTTIKLNQALKQKLQSVRTEQKREEKYIKKCILKGKRSDVNKHEDMQTKRERKRDYSIKPMDEIANLLDNHVYKNKHTCKSKRSAGYCVSYQGSSQEVESGRRPRKMGKRKGGADKAAAQEEIRGSRTGGIKEDVREDKKILCGLVDLFKCFFKKK
ncbi:ATR-like protein [Mya arenaria]|uniref:Serine/threonine-protein kinase ATR n=1 Tax=Mya arenaria TaxID=6604 RepID=A0ABY7DQP5_MYAAR|nr:ATR-like protein [Mya arenaria]